MSKKFRIKEYDYGEFGRWFHVQKKSIFGFWYLYPNSGADEVGSYGTLKEAEMMIRMHLNKVKTRILKVAP